MTATLWLNTEREETIDLGGTLPLYAAFAEMARAAGPDQKNYPDLFGVLSQVEDQADAPADWLEDVKDQAKVFLSRHGSRLSGAAQWVLKQLIGHEQEEPS